MARTPPINAITEKAALELGYINIRWAWLEHAIDQLIAELAHIDEQNVSGSITANADIRGKIQMAKALSFIRKDDDEWFNHITKLLNYIDNDLRPRRNTYVHAGWFTPKGRLTRKTPKTKLQRPQSYQLTLTTVEEVPVKLSELRKLNVDMLHTLVQLIYGFWYIFRGDKPVDETLPHIPFSQYLRLVTLEIRRNNKSSTRKRQPKSSRA